MKKRLHLTVHGRVQGVVFRYSTRRIARELEITGFVKNLSDGTVEVIAEGEEENLKTLLEHCRKGPFFAKVIKVEEEWSEFIEEFKEFNIEYF